MLAGRNKQTSEIVAIKVLEKYEDDTRQQRKLQSELEIIAKLDHPNIVKFFQFDEGTEHLHPILTFQDEENFYVVMELVSGGELFDQIVTQRYYYEREAAPLIAQVLQGVTYLHDREIAHRDLKPENRYGAYQNSSNLRLVCTPYSHGFGHNSWLYFIWPQLTFLSFVQEQKPRNYQDRRFRRV